MMRRPLQCPRHINVISLNNLKGSQGSEDDFWNLHASPLKEYIFLNHVIAAFTSKWPNITTTAVRRVGILKVLLVVIRLYAPLNLAIKDFQSFSKSWILPPRKQISRFMPHFKIYYWSVHLQFVFWTGFYSCCTIFPRVRRRGGVEGGARAESVRSPPLPRQAESKAGI